MRAKISMAAAIASALAMSVAGAASASAAEFNGPKGSLEAKALATQTFKTAAGNVECEKLSATGTVEGGKKPTQNATVTYETCKAFGHTATVSPAHYEFNANGSVKIITEAITVTVKVEGVTKCTVTVPTQTIEDEPSSQEGVEFENLAGGNLKVIPEPVTNIASEGKGTLCEYNELGTAAKGTYTGASEVHDTGGAIEIEGVQP